MSEPLVLGLLMIVVVLVIGLPLARRLAARPPPRAAARTAEPVPPDDDEGDRDSPATTGGTSIVGTVRRGSMKTVGDIVAKHPGEAASVLRRWMRGDRPPEP